VRPVARAAAQAMARARLLPPSPHPHHWTAGKGVGWVVSYTSTSSRQRRGSCFFPAHRRRTHAPHPHTRGGRRTAVAWQRHKTYTHSNGRRGYSYGVGVGGLEYLYMIVAWQRHKTYTHTRGWVRGAVYAKCRRTVSDGRKRGQRRGDNMSLRVALPCAFAALLLHGGDARRAYCWLTATPAAEGHGCLVMRRLLRIFQQDVSLSWLDGRCGH
jgi:hypothetical protein